MLYETLMLSFRTILRNALRSGLTVLGIVIGVAAVIVMVTLGQGTTAQVTSDVAKLGSNLLMVRPGQAGPGPASASADTRDFNDKDVKAIGDQVQGVEVVGAGGLELDDRDLRQSQPFPERDRHRQRLSRRARLDDRRWPRVLRRRAAAPAPRSASSATR